MMTIHIESLTFEAIIGLLDFERERPQRVIVDLEASYSYTNKQFIDYAELSERIVQQVQQSRYKLLEEALLSLEKGIITSYPQIQTLRLKISKPDILHNCRVALSSEWDYKI